MKYDPYHGLRSQKWIDGRYQSWILYAMLIQVMSNLLPGLRVVLESFARTFKQIVLNKNATFLVKNSTYIQRQRNPTMKFFVWNPVTCLRLQISLKANQSHLTKSAIAYDFPTPTDVIVIKNWFHLFHPEENKKYHHAPKKKVIPCLMLSWKILSGIFLLRWYQQVRPASLAFCHHN